AMSLLLQVNAGPRCATSPPVAKSPQPLRPPVGTEIPADDIIARPGQITLSIIPMATFEPAWLEPPSVGHTFVAPMKLVLSSSGWLSESLLAADTPGSHGHSAHLF